MMKRTTLAATKAWIALLLFCCSVQQCAGDMHNIDLTCLITDVTVNEITFMTGHGIPGSVNRAEVKVFDQCSFHEGTQTCIGVWFPASMAVPIPGIETDITGINPDGIGTGSVLGWSFVVGIADNPDVYTQFNASYSELKFCVQVSLFVDDTLLTWDELDIFIPMDMSMNLGGGQGVGDDGMTLNIQTIARENFFDAYEFNYTLDGGDLNAYFCDKDTHLEISSNVPVHQGSIISVCFNVADTATQPFEVEDILELYIEDLGKSLAAETIVETGVVASGGYVEKVCEPHPTLADTDTCIASFILRADFYDFPVLVLTGYGAVVLNFGDAGTARTRKLVQVGFRDDEKQNETMSGSAVAGFELPMHRYLNGYPNLDDDSAATAWSHCSMILLLASMTTTASLVSYWF